MENLLFEKVIKSDGKIHKIFYKKSSFLGISFVKKFYECETNLEISDDFMNVKDYFNFAKEGLDKNSSGNKSLDILYCAVGMTCEVGEVIDHVNKHTFHSNEINKTKLISELGDLMWYTFNLMRLLDVKFSDVINGNIIKLKIRYPNGRSKGIELNKNHINEDDAIAKEINKPKS